MRGALLIIVVLILAFMIAGCLDDSPTRPKASCDTLATKSPTTCPVR